MTRQAKYLSWRQSTLNNKEVDELPILKLRGSWLLRGRTYARLLSTATRMLGTRASQVEYVPWLVFFH